MTLLLKKIGTALMMLLPFVHGGALSGGINPVSQQSVISDSDPIAVSSDKKQMEVKFDTPIKDPSVTYSFMVQCSQDGKTWRDSFGGSDIPGDFVPHVRPADPTNPVWAIGTVDSKCTQTRTRVTSSKTFTADSVLTLKP